MRAGEGTTQAVAKTLERNMIASEGHPVGAEPESLEPLGWGSYTLPEVSPSRGAEPSPRRAVSTSRPTPSMFA